MAERRIAEDPDRVAFLYVDGHVHEYYGQHPLAKAKKRAASGGCRSHG